MRVLIWGQYFWPETFRINDIAVALSKAGHEVTVLTGKPNYPEGRYYRGYRFLGIVHDFFEGVRIVRIPLLNRGRSKVQLALNYLSFVLFGYALAPWALRGRAYDAIFIYAPSPIMQALPAFVLGRLKGAPTVLWVQDIWPEVLTTSGMVRSPFIIGVVERIVRYIYSRSTLILVQSEAFRVSVESRTSHKEKIHYFPNPAEKVSDATAARPTAKALAARMKTEFAVVFTGNIGKAQSVGTILGAAALLKEQKDVCIHLVGSGSEAEFVATEIERMQLSNVVLTHRLPLTDMPTILSAAAVLLVTLADDAVGAATIPSKLQSYLAAGRPIVASMNGEGSRLISEAQAGLCCPAEAPDRLAELISRMRALSAAERLALGENGRRYFLAHFELNLLTRRLSALFALAQDKMKDRY